MKGYVLLTDGCTAVKASHAKTLMSKELRIQLVYADCDSDDVRKLTIWYWLKTSSPILLDHHVQILCPFDTSHNWSTVNGSTLYSGGFGQYAILKELVDVSLFAEQMDIGVPVPCRQSFRCRSRANEEKMI